MMSYLRNILLLTGVILILVACKNRDSSEKVDEGRIVNQTYTSDEIGWTIEVPKGWNVMSKDDQKEIDKKGQAA